MEDQQHVDGWLACARPGSAWPRVLSRYRGLLPSCSQATGSRLGFDRGSVCAPRSNAHWPWCRRRNKGAKNMRRFLQGMALGCVFLLSLLAGGFVVASQPEQRVTDGRLNVVLILVDDLGWMDLSCQGSDYFRTPHIDRLASQGCLLYTSPSPRD